jgi:hypothetical protein
MGAEFCVSQLNKKKKEILSILIFSHASVISLWVGFTQPPVIVYHFAFAECLRIFSIYYCQIISPKAYQNLGSTIYGTIKTLRCVYELITQHVALRKAAAELDDFFVTQC